MSVFKQHVVPFLIVFAFVFALFVVSIRNFLPPEMLGPAPISATDLASLQS